MLAESDPIVIGLLCERIYGHDDHGVGGVGTLLEQEMRAREHDSRGRIAPLGLQDESIATRNLRLYAGLLRCTGGDGDILLYFHALDLRKHPLNHGDRIAVLVP